MTKKKVEEAATTQYVTLTVGEQLFGINVMNVHDVLKDLKINSIPLAPQEVAGSLNLRGRIVTAIDLRRKMGLPNRDKDAAKVSIVVEHHNEMYSLVVDQVGEVLTLEDKKFSKPPVTLDKLWRDYAAGIFQLEKKLLIILDIDKLFYIPPQEEVA